MGTQNVDDVLEKTYVIVVRVVNFQGDKPIKNVNVRVFRLEMEPITIKQWAENLKNGSPFEKLVRSMNTDDNGNVSAELAEGSYEVEVEKYGLSKVLRINSK